MSMDHWDKFIAPVLRIIEHRAHAVAYNAREITAAVNMLPGRPDFETRAEEKLGIAEVELADALDAVRFARQVYAEKEMLEAAE